MATLSEAEIARRLEGLPGWSREDQRISRQFSFATFPDAVAFITRLGFEAERTDHHPDIYVHYRKVTLVYWTHSEGGLTDKDFAGATTADSIAAPMPQKP